MDTDEYWQRQFGLGEVKESATPNLTMGMTMADEFMESESDVVAVALMGLEEIDHEISSS